MEATLLGSQNASLPCPMELPGYALCSSFYLAVLNDESVSFVLAAAVVILVAFVVFAVESVLFRFSKDIAANESPHELSLANHFPFTAPATSVSIQIWHDNTVLPRVQQQPRATARAAARLSQNLHVQAADPSHISTVSSLWAEPNGLLPATMGRILPARLTEHLVQAARITFGSEQQDLAQICGIFLAYIEEEEELLLVSARLRQRQREKDEEILRLWQEEQEQR
ncbi:hypothetical protein ColLi_13267 [Colletotrichum liriopes]|uniref:Transmembrane protein n=1 Tax=Colletotrichum liriopes TaxID=708192 RepID=A0AA37LZK1_9PEZI|nr:hypothetical protein ColLi_13267 [Colletotrichum liriopes]